MSEKEETPDSSPFQQVPGNKSLQRGTSYDNYSMHSNGPCLKILVEPQGLFRFRYKTETEGGSHGYLQGDHLAPDMSKTYPTVELRNYKDAAVIKCQVYQHDKDLEHPHRLYDESRGDKEPIKEVSEGNGYIVCFKRLEMIHTAKKYVFGQLYHKLEKSMERGDFEKLDKKTLREYCKKIDLNRVRLRFSAHDPTTDKELCSVFSRTIYNNSNISVKFFEKNSKGERVWEAEAYIVEVHHTYGICIRTPPYENKTEEEITECVDVWMELVRTTDGRCSDPRAFRYTPEPHHQLRKRAKIQTITPKINEVLPDVCIELAIPLELDAVAAYIEPNPSEPEECGGVCDEPYEPPNPHDMPTELLNDVINLAPSDTEDFQNFLLHDWDALMLQYPLLGEDNPFMTQQDDLRLETDNPHPASKYTKSYLLCGNTTEQGEVIKTDSSLKLEDIVEIRTLIKDILDLKRKKLREWYEEVNKKLETLFEIRMSNGDTILHFLLYNNEAGLERLVELASSLRRPDLLSAADRAGRTVLQHAVARDCSDLVHLLVQRGSDPLCGDCAGDNALHYAVVCGGAMLPPLLRAMADRCAHDKGKMDWKLRQTNYECQSPLWVAVDRQCVNSIRLLLEHYDSSRSMDVDCEGRSPIHVAIEHDRPDIVSMLIKATPWRDGGLDSCSHKGRAGAGATRTALQAACAMAPRAHTADIVTMLLEHGADPMLTNHIDDDPAWLLARLSGGAAWAALSSRLPAALLAPPAPAAHSDSDDDFHSADDGDSDASEVNIVTTLEAMNLYKNRS